VADDILNEIWCSALAADVELEMPCGKCVACRAAEEIERLRAEVDLKGYRVDRLLNALEDIDHLIVRYATVEQLRHRIKEARRVV
jgi:hypothetical protein